MEKSEILDFYSRKDVQREITSTVKNREVAVNFTKTFGKRPDIIQFESDILELAKKGATSFHISEERWSDPLKLKPGMTKQQLDDLRIGWDLVLDIDCKTFEYSKIGANLVIEALKFHNIKNIGLKFSGGSGFHIAIPFEAFPRKVNNIEIKLLFPEGPRVIADYIKQLIREPLSAQLLLIDTKEEIAKKTGKKEKDLFKQNNFDPFLVLNIDSVLISNRHLFRSPYSFNEKTNLISVPLDYKNLDTFTKELAHHKKVIVEQKFFKKAEPNEASELVIQAFDWHQKNKKDDTPFEIRKEYDLPKIKISEKNFPPCIKLILAGIKEDGRKRALFILINFLKSSGYEMKDIVTLVTKWNQKNYEPLKEGYIQSQISWHRRQKQIVLPPNCDHSAYYKDLLICKQNPFCRKIKNPVNYAKLRASDSNKKEV